MNENQVKAAEVARAKNTEEKLKAIFSSVKGNLLSGYDRWIDEKDYEDINDYSGLFREKVQNGGGSFVKMTRRPFGFVAEINGLKFQFYVNSGAVGARGA